MNHWYTRLSRRAVGVLAALAAAVAGGAARAAGSPGRAELQRLLARVGPWGCQYQNLRLAEIAASPLDLIVIEPVVDPARARIATPEEVRRLQRKPDGGRRLVLAYLSVGAAEAWRRYWQTTWQRTPPAWLGKESSEWPRSYPVRYWHPEWQAIVADGLGRLLAAGFDGVFLDRVDAYHDWRDERPQAQQDMVAFLAALIGAARVRHDGFLVVGQNGEHLLADVRYRQMIDAISKESLLYGLQGPGLPNREEDVAWSLAHLLPAQRAGLPVLAIEYVSEPAAVAAAGRRLRDLGFVPFFGNRLLDRLPTTPGGLPQRGR